MIFGLRYSSAKESEVLQDAEQLLAALGWFQYSWDVQNWAILLGPLILWTGQPDCSAGNTIWMCSAVCMIRMVSNRHRLSIYFVDCAWPCRHAHHTTVPPYSTLFHTYQQAVLKTVPPYRTTPSIRTKNRTSVPYHTKHPYQKPCLRTAPVLQPVPNDCTMSRPYFQPAFWAPI